MSKCVMKKGIMFCGSGEISQESIDKINAFTRESDKRKKGDDNTEALKEALGGQTH